MNAGLAMVDRLSFELPPALEAREPAEARGMTRDAVRMLVAQRATGSLTHSTFVLLPTFLNPGDLVVVNTSGVIPAAVRAMSLDGVEVVLHFSTRLDDERWVVELRLPVRHTTERWTGPVPRDLLLGEGASAHIDEPYLGSDRLWIATLSLPQPVLSWLAVHGQPIRYGYVDRAWPLTTYQNVYA